MSMPRAFSPPAWVIELCCKLVIICWSLLTPRVCRAVETSAVVCCVLFRPVQSLLVRRRCWRLTCWSSEDVQGMEKSFTSRAAGMTSHRQSPAVSWAPTLPPLRNKGPTSEALISRTGLNQSTRHRFLSSYLFPITPLNATQLTFNIVVLSQTRLKDKTIRS